MYYLHYFQFASIHWRRHIDTKTKSDENVVRLRNRQPATPQIIKKTMNETILSLLFNATRHTTSDSYSRQLSFTRS